MTFKVLFVCSANVCRSRSAAVMFGSQLSAVGLLAHVRVDSAGTDAVPGEPWCSYDRANVDASQDGLKPLVSSMSRSATPRRLRDSDLLLCADRTTLRSVLRANPQVRNKVFTIQEGGFLATRVTAPRTGGTSAFDMVEDMRDLPQKGEPFERLRWLVAEMDAARGQIPLAEPSRLMRLVHREPVDQLDIADVHSRGGRAHKQMLKTLTNATTELAQAFEAVMQNETDQSSASA